MDDSPLKKYRRVTALVKKYIHINQHKIKSNLKHKTNKPVITVKIGKQNIYGHEVELLGSSKVIYGGNDKPLLSCGARVILTTNSNVIIDGKEYG